MKNIKNLPKEESRGFTLIELLVVIAIIGILSGVVLASLNSARAKARDAARVTDVQQITKALALYYDSNLSYPTALAALVTAELLTSEPKDPSSTTTPYSYAVKADGSTFHLGAVLEQAPTDSGVLATDKDCTSLSAATDGDGTPSCFGEAVTAENGGFTGRDGTNLVYDVMP